MKSTKVTLAILSILLIVSAPTVMAQGPGSGPGNGPGIGPGSGQGLQDGSALIRKINRVLDHAGAPGLTASQEEAIAALIESHRANRPERGPDPSHADLHSKYLEAILAGDLETAQVLATQIAEAMAQRTAERMQAQAQFQIELLSILDPESQLAVLMEQEGTRGILRLLGPNSRRGQGGRPGPRGFGSRGQN